jgi:hypothetical protein
MGPPCALQLSNKSENILGDSHRDTIEKTINGRHKKSGSVVRFSISLGLRCSAKYSKCQKFFPNYPENPLFEKSRFSGPFRQKLLSCSEITLMLFRTLPIAPGSNKVSENEKTSGNRYKWQDALKHKKSLSAMIFVLSDAEHTFPGLQ